MALTNLDCAVIGAGIIGRLLAWRLKSSGSQVTLYEASSRHSQGSASAAAGGLLTPLQESLFSRSPRIWDMGRDAVARWEEIAKSLKVSYALKARGSLVMASGDGQVADRAHFAEQVNRFGLTKHLQKLQGAELFEYEPGLRGGYIDSAFHIDCEGAIDTSVILECLLNDFADQGGLLRFEDEIQTIDDGHVVTTKGKSYRYAQVFDTRGLGAKKDLPNLRPVRGELVMVRRPELTLESPLRLLNHRYPLYIVPRTEQRFALGATQLESHNDGPVTVQSALELLYAAWQVHPEFRYAEIVDMKAQCRPTLPSDEPVIERANRTTRINGLYRNGFLLAPYLVEQAIPWN